MIPLRIILAICLLPFLLLVELLYVLFVLTPKIISRIVMGHIEYNDFYAFSSDLGNESDQVE